MGMECRDKTITTAGDISFPSPKMIVPDKRFYAAKLKLFQRLRSSAWKSKHDNAMR